MAPDSSAANANDFDWSTPVAGNQPKAESLEFDWSTPVNGKEDKLDLKWSDDEDDDKKSNDSEDGISMKELPKQEATPAAPSVGQSVDAEHGSGRLDIMAQQLKFVACLKILMGEMATLATGFEVDGGQLRLQLYLWLDRELQVGSELCCYLRM